MTRRPWARVALVPTACALAGAAAALGAWSTRPAKDGFAPCLVWAVREVGRCGTVRVFEDRDARRGRTIPLRVVVLPSRGPGPSGEPVVFLNGGPGLGAVAGAAYAAEALGGLRPRHALVLADQRGTGRSAPLGCALAGEGLAGLALQPYAGPVFPAAAARRCRARLAGRADLSQYTTARAADDLADVLDALGVRRASLFGASYGGRLALAFLRRHPGRVRAAVALSAPPPERVVPLAAGWAGARALAARAAECRADAACGALAPDPEGDVRRVVAALAARPARVTRWNWRRLRREAVVVTPRGFAEYAWSRLYDGGRARELFAVAHRAAAGDWAPLADAAVRRGRWREHGSSRGLTLSVLCAEDAPRIPGALAGAERAAGALGVPVAAELVTACAEWPRGALAPADTLPVRSAAPVLFLSGALDPAVPPEWTDSARRFLPNSWHWVRPGAGHAEFDGCARAALTAFVEAAGASAGAVTPGTRCPGSWAPGPLLANPAPRR